MDGIRCCLVFFSCVLITQLSAQTDSLYVDEMKRDGITNLNTINSCQRQIITAEQIRLSGYTRTSDLFQLLDAYTFSTINGDRWYIQANGTSAYQNQNWVLMVDGQRMELEKFDAVHINMLGIPITEIERIEIVNTPILYIGEFADKGLIQIITKKNYTGFSYRGYYNQGNETGDPGPYRYTPYATANVDRIGMNTSHSLGFRKNNFSINGTFTYQEYYARDSFIVGRYQLSAPDAAPKSALTSGRIEMNWKTRWISQQIQGAYTLTKDFFYNPIYSLEYLTDRKLANGGYLAEISLSRSSKIRFNTTISYETNEPVNSLTGVGANTTMFPQTVSHSNIYYQFIKPFKRDFVKWQLGTSYTFFRESIENRSRFLVSNLLTPFTSLSIPLTRRSWLTTDFQLVSSLKNNDQLPHTGFKSTITLYKRVSILSNWSLVSSYSERIMDEDNTLFFQYYKTLEEGNYQVSSVINNQLIPTSKQFTFDANYCLNIGHTFKLFLNSGIKYLWDQPLFNVYNFQTQYNLSYITFDNRTTNWVNRFYIRYDVLRNMMIDFNYLNTSQIDGDRDLISSIPKHKLTLIINYELPKRFNIWSRNYWQSSTTWDYSLIYFYSYTGNDKPKYVNLPSLFVWDLGVSKRFLKDYLNLNFTVRNLLNGTEKYHPNGAQFDLRLIIGLSCNIDGIFASRPKQ